MDKRRGQLLADEGNASDARRTTAGHLGWPCSAYFRSALCNAYATVRMTEQRTKVAALDTGAPSMSNRFRCHLPILVLALLIGCEGGENHSASLDESKFSRQMLDEENTGPSMEIAEQDDLTPMDEPTFWELIQRTRVGAGGDPKQQEARLRRELESLNPTQIAAFGKRFSMYVHDAYHWDLWGAAYVIGGGCSDDGFWDFRAWLVSQGEDTYKAAIADPESLLDVVDKDDPDRNWLRFLDPSMFVWGEKMGKGELGLDEYPGTVGSNLGDEPAGEQWEEDEDLARRYPTLWEKFGW